jgi:hypothetical protein
MEVSGQLHTPVTTVEQRKISFLAGIQTHAAQTVARGILFILSRKCFCLISYLTWEEIPVAPSDAKKRRIVVVVTGV